MRAFLRLFRHSGNITKDTRCPSFQQTPDSAQLALLTMAAAVHDGIISALVLEKTIVMSGYFAVKNQQNMANRIDFQTFAESECIIERKRKNQRHMKGVFIMGKAKARILGILLCLAMLFSIMPAQAAPTAAEEYVTREEAVVSLLDTIGLDALNDTPTDLSVFSDADQISSEYVDEMAVAVANGLLPVAPGEALNPGKNITRLEFALLVSNSMRELPIIRQAPAFTDVPAEAAGELDRVASAGLMSGYGNGCFGSDDCLTKTQLETVLNKIKALSSVRPQDDFFYAINHDWLAGTRLPAGYASYTTFDEVGLRKTDKLKAIVKEMVEKRDTYQEGTIEQKIVDFYLTVLDMENRNKEGIKPIEKYLDLIDGASTAQELLDAIVQIQSETGMSLIVGFAPDIDLMDSNRYSLYGGGLGIGLPRDYLLMENPQIENMYKGVIARMLMLSGASEDEAASQAQSLYDFEKTIAASTMSNEEASKVENIYNPVSRSELVRMFPSVDLDKYLNDLGYGSVEQIILSDVELMKKTGELLADQNLDVLKTYCRFHILAAAAPYLSQEYKDVIQNFQYAFYGVNTAMNEEDIAFNMLDSVMSDYLGRMYVEQCFSAEAKADVESIVSDIIADYQKRIEALDWMSEETKEKAISKLKSMKIKVGYPDKWDDPLKNVSIKTYEEGGSLLGNIFAISCASVKEAKTLLSKPVDKTKWYMPAHTVNAYYNATNNEIVFPAGILQPPFYDLEASREENLGGIGTVIAHEITHAFDNNGAQFDENGNMSNWWTEQDYTVFRQKCQAVADLYNGLAIAPNAAVNGNLTLSENVADIGAVACILDIAEDIPDVDYKALFESYARIWRQTATEQTYQMLAMQDSHAPNKYRVNRVLQNFQEFYDTYNIQPGDAMYLAPEKRVTIW